MSQTSGVPRGIDTTAPSSARVYDFYLGGTHNFPVDREMAQRVMAARPDVPLIVAQNRMFLQRAVRYLVEQGITQFLDIGSGIPTVGATHEVALELNPDARVVYVDLDPVALAHSATVLEDVPNAIIIDRDLRRPEELTADPELNRMLDLSKPVAVMVISLVHFLTDDDDPAGIFTTLRQAMSPGSFLAVSAASRDDNEDTTAAVAKEYARSPDPMVFRTRAEFESLYFGGFEMVEPGLVRLPLWRPESNVDVGADPDLFPGYAGVGKFTDGAGGE